MSAAATDTTPDLEASLAVMKNRVCSGCKMVYPESHEMLKYRNFVHSCEYCGRFLVVTDKSA